MQLYDWFIHTKLTKFWVINSIFITGFPCFLRHDHTVCSALQCGSKLVFLLLSRWRASRPTAPACSIRSCGVSRMWRRTGRLSAWPTSLSSWCRGRPRLCRTRWWCKRRTITVTDPNPPPWSDTPARTVSHSFSGSHINTGWPELC